MIHDVPGSNERPKSKPDHTLESWVCGVVDINDQEHKSLALENDESTSFVLLDQPIS